MRNKRKLRIGAAFVVAGLMLGRLAYAIINDPISTFIIIVAALLFLGGTIYFAMNFRE
jgi:hypothetical protein